MLSQKQWLPLKENKKTQKSRGYKKKKKIHIIEMQYLYRFKVNIKKGLKKL